MTFSKSFTLVGVFALFTVLGAAQRPQTEPTISYGTAGISLGMTVEQVEQHLAQAARHTKPVSDDDKNNLLVYLNGGDADFEGQIAFRNGRVVYADYQMPVTDNSDDLAQEIAGAIENMETKTCTASNYSAHGTGGGFTQSTFECGSKRFFVMTVQALGSNVRRVNVHIEIGQMVAK
jgi:hypothetical protein